MDNDIGKFLALNGRVMWRSVFIALGIMAVIVGVECLFIDSATLYQPEEVRQVSLNDPAFSMSANPAKVVRPKDWMPWAFISGGIITVVYSYHLPVHYRRWRNSPAN